VDKNSAILRGVKFVVSRQAKDGHFASEVSLMPNMSDSHEEKSVYIHSYVVQALSSTRGPVSILKAAVPRAASYLRSAQEKSGWWKFYGPAQAEPPDDADDTAMAFSALLSSARPVNRQLAKNAISWLKSLERIRSESGLYKTWSDAEWNEEGFHLPDIVVNSNILFLQTMVGCPDPRVTDYLVRAIKTEAYQVLNLFAVSTYAVPFLISRCNQSAAIPEFQAQMEKLGYYVLCRQEPGGGWGGDLDTMLAILTLMNTRCLPRATARSAVRCLLERQQGDGGWNSGPLFRDLRPRYYGSRILTTALCVEALTRLSVSDC
jgi:A-macroglobulin complement component/prenyltransferase/squalene oxidase-like repeat protein